MNENTSAQCLRRMRAGSAIGKISITCGRGFAGGFFGPFLRFAGAFGPGFRRADRAESSRRMSCFSASSTNSSPLGRKIAA
ncbi:hypothetical protein FVF75_16130 [Maritimibacter fusiformis]|uniref:Uncharacterized protein n=1 Tax=Maritimibacter fusiformis TaxID=2603819 RepID=A0A5D0R802_9RHOB|nr:hypothetical protein FVF75_16130 [Maritimibacter fusiformis]